MVSAAVGVFGGLGLRWPWVDAWLRGCVADMLIVSGRGQEVVLDEPERHLAGECRRDDWAVSVVSACCPFSVRVCGFCISALMFLCKRWVYFGGYGAADGMGRSVAAWLHADCVGARAGSCPRRA